MALVLIVTLCMNFLRRTSSHLIPRTTYRHHYYSSKINFPRLSALPFRKRLHSTSPKKDRSVIMPKQKLCKNCNTVKLDLFGKAYGFTGLCKVCNDLELDRQRADAKQRKEEFNNALALVEVYELDPSISLHFIDTFEGLLFFESKLPHCILAGLDTETRPMFVKGSSDKHPTALLQVALRCQYEDKTSDAVFVIDLLTLSQDPVSHTHFSHVLLSFFGNDRIVKLGQGLDLDIREVIEAYCDIFFKHQTTSSLSSVLEISDLHDLYTENKINSVKVSLQKMTFHHLNKKLLKSKSLTLSNWNARPLSKAQLKYAASDAVVLLDLFDHLTCVRASESSVGHVITEKRLASLTKSFIFNKESGSEGEEKNDKRDKKKKLNDGIAFPRSTHEVGSARSNASANDRRNSSFSKVDKRDSQNLKSKNNYSQTKKNGNHVGPARNSSEEKRVSQQVSRGSDGSLKKGK